MSGVKRLQFSLTLGFGLATLGLAACSQPDTVTIGALLPITGSAAVYGDAIQKGVELGVEKMQADESLPYGITLDLRDTGSDPETAARLAREMTSGSGAVVAVIGGVTSDEALALVPVARDTEKLFFSPTASSSELSRSARTLFRLFITTAQEGSAMANFADDTLKIERLAILVEPGPYGDQLLESFTSSYEGLGGEVTAVVEIAAGADDAELVAQALADEPVGVYVIASGQVTPRLVKALRNAGFTTGIADNPHWILATSAFGSPAVIAEAGEAGNQVYITQSQYDVDSEEPGVATFVAAYRAKYGSDPDIYAAHGYDSALLVGEALKMVVNLLPSEMLKGIFEANLHLQGIDAA